MAVAALALAAALLVPDSWGRLLFNDTWPRAERLLLPMGLTMIAGGALSGGLLGIRALGDARRSLRARLWTTPVMLGAPLLGAVLDDAGGFVLGMAVAHAVAAVVWWSLFELAPPATETTPDANSNANGNGRAAVTATAGGAQDDEAAKEDEWVA